MLNRLVGVISGVGTLIALYLVLSRGTAANNLLRTLGGIGIDATKTLQGR